jgi:hypothetical protein
VGNAELFLDIDDANVLDGADYIFADTTAVTALVDSDITYGATITPSASWLAIADNSRFYPMNEGTGTAMTETLNAAEGSGTFSSTGGWGTTAGWEIIYNNAVRKTRSMSGATAFTIAITDQVVIAPDGTSGTLTLPSATAMTTGYTAAEIEGWTVLIKNNKSGNLVVTVGASTTCPCTARLTIPTGEDRWFTYSGATAVWT